MEATCMKRGDNRGYTLAGSTPDRFRPLGQFQVDPNQPNMGWHVTHVTWGQPPAHLPART